MPIVWSVAATDFTDVNAGIARGDVVDGDEFDITSDGVLSFETPPNYEAPTGGTDDDSNTYAVTVVASDGSERDYYKVLVTVTNIDEPGKVTWTVGPGGTQLTPARSLLQFFSGAELSASVADGDGNIDITWKWHRGSSPISDETSTTYVVGDDDIGKHIRAEASYRESANKPIKKVSFTSENRVLADRAATNNNPEFDSDTVSRGVAENAAVGDSVGGPITASDADGDTLTYSIPAATSNFAINAATGRLTVKAGAMLNHDPSGGDMQEVEVTVTDPEGGTDNTAVTITITDVNEAPGFADADTSTTPQTNPSVADIAENSTSHCSASRYLQRDGPGW